MIIAVDGPTASGKGTIAKRLAAHFGVPHLDTGLLYRAVGRQVAIKEGRKWPGRIIDRGVLSQGGEEYSPQHGE